MVIRLQSFRMTSTGSRAVLFVDLDGTLVLDNSFHLFLRAIAELGTVRLRLVLFCALGLRLVGRFSGGHEGLKRRVLVAFSIAPESCRSAIIDRTLDLLEHVRSRPIMSRIVAWQAAGGRVVLATAAPDWYAVPFARIVGIGDCIATAGVPARGWHELLAAAKAAACSDWLVHNGFGPGTRVGVLTDHTDDLDLLRISGEATVQANPACFARITQALAGKGPRLEHIDPVSSQEGGGSWLWFDDRPVGPLDPWEVRTILTKHRYALIYGREGRWRRIRRGRDIGIGVPRVDCPIVPDTHTRLLISAKRRIVRDWIGLFH